MRTIKVLTIALLSLIALSLLGNKYFQGFKATAQGGGLTAPTNLSATDNAYAAKVGVTWDAIRGAALYRVFRNTANNSATATAIGTTADSVFFDNTAAPNQIFFYWVRAENGAVTSSLSLADSGVRTGGNVVGPVPPLNPPPAPAGNVVTAAKAYLGKALFWDEQLSSTRTVACGTCHFSANGGSDARAIFNNNRSRNPGADATFNTADDVFASPGVISNKIDGTYEFSPVYGFREQVTGRKSRSYVDAGYSNLLFWDGRATGTFTDPIGGGVVLANGAALESQAVGPPVSAAEMAHSTRNWIDVAVQVSVAKPLALSPSVPANLRQWIDGRTYPQLFEEAFGTSEVTPARIAMAIATFERTLYSDQTPFDQSVQQIGALTAAETRGQGVFNASRCNVCHAGTLFTDNAFHNVGVRPQTEDTGRFQVTGNTNNIGEFRTPSLRNVGLRGPYMHNGHFATLDEVVEFYNRGGDFDAPNINRNLIRPLNLSPQQKSDLLAFLRRPLTDPRVAAGVGQFDRPTLYTESSRVPQIVASGTTGSGGLVPQVAAIEPPIVGNPSFTVGISGALGGAQAVLVIDSNDPGTGPSIPNSPSLARVVVPLLGSGAGQGVGSASIGIRDDDALIGQSFTGRWFVSDPNAANGMAVSQAFRFTVFGEVSGINEIDETAFFVHQHYVDFLNREPETGGFNGWQTILNGCATGDIRCDRIEVSSAFFRSEEFQSRGYFAYRFYPTLGRIPHYMEFMPDLAKVSGFLTTDQLEARKTAFVQEFMARPEFGNKYDPLTTPTAYVDGLLQAVGLPNHSSRSAWITGLSNSSMSRAQVLRALVDSSELNTKYFNEAFVVMQYFGYLRRDPDILYLDWINTMNQNGGDYRVMINGFMNSREYRQRFGP
ncbi:MAG TPA: cytochrome c peroxidase [Pyrinomonadaceae bacterium]|nr:cytochrome c peroxidase [Pyrinomonadaceae bacterium]